MSYINVCNTVTTLSGKRFLPCVGVCSRACNDINTITNSSVGGYLLTPYWVQECLSMKEETEDGMEVSFIESHIRISITWGSSWEEEVMKVQNQEGDGGSKKDVSNIMFIYNTRKALNV